ncbi:MAG: hypothetical protein V3T42_09060 [Nitrospirales bacterium]
MQGVRVPTIVGLVTFMLFVLVGSLSAQVSIVSIEPETISKGFRFYSGYGHLFKTDLDRKGNFSRDGFRFLFNGEVEFTPNFRLVNIASYDFNHYDFSSSSRFQWNDIHFANYVPLFTWKADEQWTILAAPIVRLNLEGDTKVKDSVRGGGGVGFIYSSSPTLTLGLILGVMDQIEDDVQFLPIPLIRWQFADSWTFRTAVSNLGGQNGLGAEVAWQWTPKVEMVGGAAFQRRRFRLNTNEQVGQETLIPIYGKLSLGIHPQGKLELFVGVAAGGELRLENKNGNKIREEDYDATAMLGAQLDFVF